MMPMAISGLRVGDALEPEVRLFCSGWSGL